MKSLLSLRTALNRNRKKVKAKRTKSYDVAIVQEGDTFGKLAKIVYGSSDPLSVQRVLDFNPKMLHPKNIFPSQDIVFPRVEEAKDLTRDSPQVHSREELMSKRESALKVSFSLRIAL